jgi:choice-of-anchor C domain-containing protein
VPGAEFRALAFDGPTPGQCGAGPEPARSLIPLLGSREPTSLGCSDYKMARSPQRQMSFMFAPSEFEASRISEVVKLMFGGVVKLVLSKHDSRKEGRKMKKLIVAAAFSLGVATAANAQMVTNGSFEVGPDPGGSFITLNAVDNSILGWSVDSGSIDYIGGYWPAQDGTRSIDLAGNSVGSISQLITGTVAGQLYTVNFWASRNPDGGDDLRTGIVSFGGVDMPFAYSSANSLSDMMWAPYSFNFLATGSSTSLSFAADGSAGCCYGPALDNVSLDAAVPEPATWAMMLLGFGAIGFGMRRRRKSLALTQAA